MSNPQSLPPTVTGPIDKVKCPHCGRTNDFRSFKEQHLLETGAEAECDHCHHFMTIVAVQPITLVAVRKSLRNTGRAAVAPQAKAAYTIAPGALAPRRR